ncbi:MAG: ATP-dependent DNA helicase [Patescibacteria group bacterium]
MNNPSEKKLNAEQVAAVTHIDGPLLIIAGAGTGKTTVITERIKFLIANNHATPDQILALTFTEKASDEMEERIDEALPYGYTQMWISTFHSFCDKVLRAQALHIGLDPKFSLMTTASQIQFIRMHLFEFELDYFRPLGNPNKFIGGLLQHFSRLQDEDVLADNYLAWANKKQKKLSKSSSEEKILENKKWLELAKAYKKYDDLKIANGVMDYGDLISKTLLLFRNRKNVLVEYRNKFKYVLVDEFQDTNIAQYELAKLLVGGKANITVVLDDDQAVYKWRGAAISNALQFSKDYPTSQKISLVKNYRSAQKILDAAYKLIQNNNPDRLEVSQNINKKLVADNKKLNGEISFLHLNRVENEAEEVAKKIVELTNDGDFSFKDIAILVRANNHSEAFMKTFDRHGIPYQFLGPGKLFKQAEIVDLIAYLKVLVNYEDSVSFYRLLTSDFLNLSGKDLVAIGNTARKENLSFYEVIKNVDILNISKDSKQKLKKLIEVLDKHIELSKKETAGQIAYFFLQDMGILTQLLNPEEEAAQNRALNITKFFEKLKTYEVDHQTANVPEVIDWIDLSSEIGESPLAADVDWSEVNAVNILTVHGSKGLEFPIVFLVNLVSQRFPSTQRHEQIPIPEELIKEILPQGDHHLQEERRLFYVGMTRAKQKLFLTAALFYGEGKRDKKLSPFIYEALDQKTFEQTVKQKSDKKTNFSDFEKIENLSNSQERQHLSINYLSHSQIETFQTCPLHYKLKYIVKVPTPQTASQSFGTSMHAAMKNFYEVVKRGEKPTQILLHDLLKQNWIKQGYTSKAHEKEFFEKGKSYLTGYLEKEFNKDRLPILMEEKFVLPLESSRPLKIGGIIDRVDVLPDGNIEIVDYKTGATVPSQKDVDKNSQLSFYALAATTLNQHSFNKDPKQVKLSLYYFENQQKISTLRTKEDLLRAKAEILNIRDEIQNSDFKCNHNYFCANCEFAMFCNSD